LDFDAKNWHNKTPKSDNKKEKIMTQPGMEKTMSIGKLLAGELQHEAISTRKLLERVPQDKLAWKPHEKSMTLARLAQHVAEIPEWTKATILSDELDFAKTPYTPPEITSTKQITDIFDKSFKESIEILEKTSDEEFMKNWTLKNGEQVYFTMPKAGVMRGFVMSHLIHHRGQLSVYLRLLDVPIPSIYGPSADEPM
jgi:uncharacterized damage-inducible protein DinB